MPNGEFKLGDLYMRDEETGEMIKLEELKEVDLNITDSMEFESELEESVPDGISIYVTGTEIDRIDNICVYFKNDKEEQ